MLFQRTTENQTGRVQVPDIESETMKILLKYVYTDSITKNEISMDLFYAADKYDLKQLSLLCEKVLKSSFSTESVIDILIQCQNCLIAKNIEDSAKSFIVQNSGKIVKTASWNDLMEKNPKFAAQILEHVVFGN